MKLIQDTIHGLLKIEDWMIKIIDTPEFQRLRRISQIGFANLVFPGANHTRFEHSLGVMEIARRLVERMEIDEDEKMEIVASALLHDIAHLPFSHCSESVVERRLGLNHENVEVVLRKGEIKDVLRDLGFNVRKMIAHIKGLSDCNVVKGDIDADRIDYLMRDSHYTGVAHGVFDAQRLINKIVFVDKKIVIDAGGLRSAESLLISRFLMYTTVYYHHVCRIARKMFEKALEFCIEEGNLKPRELFHMDDFTTINFLKASGGYPKDVVERLLNRKLFKRALYVEIKRVGVNLNRIDPSNAEREIAERAGVDEKYVIVDIPKLANGEEFEALVLVGGEMKRLDEVSSLVRALREAEKNSLMLGVYTPKEFVDKVSRVAAEFFAVDKTYQSKLF
ncbi:HD domain-containing protein [Archaeoglobus profundus]|uniref:Metal dependent phosphohydrolase n=1 Tax=Archaeoglobus profundus (strain DSM 5631 / JCM 9629 / NBRC 100127 / Av18) TaxID=572546 RepID=D2RI23_ARCPA|nr:HD domain-containing protein [Archaeoglobus profundus]ADB57948.1 metal dependent phosphohydrolase [Archaeoglobus profundus DSM 5631]